MGFYCTAFCTCLFFAMAAAGAAKDDYPLIYEINTRAWLYSLSQSEGRTVALADVPDHELDRIAGLGAGVVWLMGVWSLGPYGLHHDRTDPGLLSDYKRELPSFTMADVIGSPYAITNYTTLAAMRQRLAKRGMKLMLDFVPNHTAVDAPWAESEPKYYILCDGGSQCVQRGNYSIHFGGDYYNKGWTDTIQLNYWNWHTVSAMTHELSRVALAADWVRCDMAHDELNAEISKTWGSTLNARGYKRTSKDFWNVALPAAHVAAAGVSAIAEAYNYGFTSPLETRYLVERSGFDAAYQKGLLDKLIANNLDDLRAYVQGTPLHEGVHFTENHDEPRAAAVLGGTAQACAGSVIAWTVPGPRLMYFGQEFGYKNRLDVHLRRAEPEPKSASAEACYDNVFRVLQQPVFHSSDSTWTYSTVGNSGTAWRLVAWRWSDNASERHLVVVNFSDETGSGSIVLPDAPQQSGNIPVVEQLSNTTYMRSSSTLRSTGLVVVLDAWQSQIFKY